jgi:vesicle coat complex subunit
LAPGRGFADSRKDDVSALVKDLKSPNPKVRAAAAEDIGQMGAVRAADAKPAIPALLRVLESDRSAEVRKAAATALGKVDPEPQQVVPALRQALKDRATSVRIAAAGALGLLGDEAKDAIPDLQAAQKDKDRAVSRAAAMALRSIRSSKK